MVFPNYIADIVSLSLFVPHCVAGKNLYNNEHVAVKLVSCIFFAFLMLCGLKFHYLSVDIICIIMLSLIAYIEL